MRVPVGQGGWRGVGGGERDGGERDGENGKGGQRDGGREREGKKHLAPAGGEDGGRVLGLGFRV